MTTLHAGDVEHLVGELFEVPSGKHDVADLLLIRRRAVVRHLEQLREPEHGVERGPQLVTHRRDEVALGPARALRDSSRLLGLRAGALQLDHRVAQLVVRVRLALVEARRAIATPIWRASAAQHEELLLGRLHRGRDNEISDPTTQAAQRERPRPRLTLDRHPPAVRRERSQLGGERGQHIGREAGRAADPQPSSAT